MSHANEFFIIHGLEVAFDFEVCLWEGFVVHVVSAFDVDDESDNPACD